MILRELYLYPDLVQYPQNLTGTFRDQTRCLCNYLERNVLKKLKFKADGFKRICIIGTSNPKNKVTVNSSNVACIEVLFSEDEYLSKSGNELDEYFINMLNVGLNKLDEQKQIPLEELCSGLESFRNNAYKNEWVHKSKVIKGTGARANLNCVLTKQSFTLTLSVHKDDIVVLEKEVLNTPPDEIAFTHLFKDLLTSDDALLVNNKFGEIIYELSIKSVV